MKRSDTSNKKRKDPKKCTAIGGDMSSVVTRKEPPKPTEGNGPAECNLCKSVFPSKTKLFKHLELDHGVIQPGKATPYKMILLLGWMSDLISDWDDEVWLRGGGEGNGAGIALAADETTCKVEALLFQAIETVEASRGQTLGLSGPGDRPRSFARGSNSSQRSTHLLGIEPTAHGACDVVSYMGYPWIGSDQDWTNKVNELLPETIRVILRYTVPLSAAGTDFHAEHSCMQQRYEVILPLECLMRPEDEVPPSEPIFRRRDLKGSKPRAEKVKGEDGEHEDAEEEEEEEEEENWNKMDLNFPIDTPVGQARIAYFRRLKNLLKRFTGKHSVHNFVTGGGIPEEQISLRRIDRIYHKEIISIDCSSSMDNVPREANSTEAEAEAAAAAAALEKKDKWVVFSISGDFFLRGQVRHTLGLLLAVCRGLLPVEYLDDALDSHTICDAPSIPGWGVYLAECKYSFWEAKYSIRFDPRRLKKSHPEADTSLIENWTEKLQHYIAREWAKVDPNQSWVETFENRCKALCCKLNAMKSLLANRSLPSLQQDLQSLKSRAQANLSTVPSAYETVLKLLREADASGLWPATSLGRQSVMNEETLVEKGGLGGSFSVGVLPKHLLQPKGNELFPELLIECFKLERKLYPNRPPSATIAINRHAQFKPHRDSGAGNGQFVSLIVALGDYTGGEIVVEGVAHDIRYKPIEFDGWGERHWTLPFVGERYSLVFFTPVGITQDDLWWWNDIQEK